MSMYGMYVGMLQHVYMWGEVVSSHLSNRFGSAGQERRGIDKIDSPELFRLRKVSAQSFKLVPIWLGWQGLEPGEGGELAWLGVCCCSRLSLSLQASMFAGKAKRFVPHPLGVTSRSLTLGLVISL